jgi:hypothetical protein
MAFAFPPAAWINQDLELYHGTTLMAANAIASRGISLASCSSLTDFGQGFYTTTLQRQAITWAYTRAAIVGDKPAYLSYRVNRDALSSLETLFFVRGSFDADDYWSLVFHCRTGKPGHRPGGPVSFYDVVVGPVAAFWQQRLAIQDVDQVSFHTQPAIGLLSNSVTSGPVTC